MNRTVNSQTLARIVTEVCAPWVTNTVLFTVLGASTGALPAGVAAAALTGLIPMGGILLMMKRNTVGDHHVTTAHQRWPVYWMIFGCLMALGVLLAILPTSLELWVGLMGAMLFIIAFAVVTRRGLKVSVHSGLWLVAFSYMGMAVHPWWWLGLVVLPVVIWSRLKLVHHTSKEIVGGVVISAGIAALMMLTLWGIRL